MRGSPPGPATARFQGRDDPGERSDDAHRACHAEVEQASESDRPDDGSDPGDDEARSKGAPERQHGPHRSTQSGGRRSPVRHDRDQKQGSSKRFRCMRLRVDTMVDEKRMKCRENRREPGGEGVGWTHEPDR